MNWRNIKLVWHRELRDQLRDRRSLFMVAVLPVLLYPMLGATVFQLLPFLSEQPVKILVIGAERLESVDPPLFGADGFAESVFPVESVSNQPQFTFRQAENPEQQLDFARKELSRGGVDVAIVIPEGVAESIQAIRQAKPDDAVPQVRPPNVLYNYSRPQSQSGQRIVQAAIAAWETQIVRRNLADRDVPEQVVTPLGVTIEDVAPPGSREASMWARLLPFIVFVWALTGAFYPAVDLCAGEKERGTLESLLTSPALRSEIVLGKLFTVITFSVASAIANLASMAFTGKVLIEQINQSLPSVGDGAGLAPPTLASIAWLLISLVPMAALFSALALAVAAYARSTKEGQYYLMPLLLTCLPLLGLAIIPKVELNLGTSLIPITGMVLLLRTAIEGNAVAVLPYLPVVAVVTLASCWLAVRWAVFQFNSESVLFRESESFSPLLWLRKLYVDRGDLPLGGAAVASFAAIYFAKFVIGMLGIELSTSGFIKLVLVSQACVLLPPLLMALWLTRKPMASLGLNRPRSLWHIPLAVLLALAIHPVGLQIFAWIGTLYPLPEGLGSMLGGIELPLHVGLLLLAVLPGFCEELAFRGFVLTGLKRTVGPAAAVAISALAFGFTHAVLQQSLLASLLGVVLGLIALRSGSVLPGITFHITYNACLALRLQYHEEVVRITESSGFGWILGKDSGPLPLYSPTFTACCAIAASLLFWAIASTRRQSPPGEVALVSKVMTAQGDKSG